jgi:hypothetical protein
LGSGFARGRTRRITIFFIYGRETPTPTIRPCGTILSSTWRCPILIGASCGANGYVYESYANLQFETWTHVKIEVKGRTAKLFLNGSENPNLVVNGLKGEDLHGAVALWGYQGEEAYFSNVRITNSAPAPIKNGSDAAGTWQVKFAGDAGGATGSMKLVRDGNKLTGTWSGEMGNDLPVQGMWRDGYVDITFRCTWGKDSLQVTAHLAGWIDGDSAQGRMQVAGRADGVWTGARQ